MLLARNQLEFVTDSKDIWGSDRQRQLKLDRNVIQLIMNRETNRWTHGLTEELVRLLMQQKSEIYTKLQEKFQFQLNNHLVTRKLFYFYLCIFTIEREFLNFTFKLKLNQKEFSFA